MEKTKRIYTKIYDFTNKTLSIGLNVVICVIIVAVVLNFKNGTNSVLGYKPLYVISGSMEPVIKTGGVVVGKEVDIDESVSIGDIIGYNIEEDGATITVVHRIINMDEDGYIQTKGDNNKREDIYKLDRSDITYKIVYITNLPATISDMFLSSTSKIVTTIGMLGGLYLILREGHRYMYVETGSVMDKQVKED